MSKSTPGASIRSTMPVRSSPIAASTWTGSRRRLRVRSRARSFARASRRRRRAVDRPAARERDVSIEPAGGGDGPAILELLSAAGLPLDGLLDHLDTAVVARADDRVVGC